MTLKWVKYNIPGENMKNNKIQSLVFNAVIASIYVVLTLVFAPFSYSTKLLFIELRISETLLVLTFYNKKYGPGLIIGCFLANLLGSTLGIIDWVFGTMQTALSVLTYLLIKKLPLKQIPKLAIGTLINSIHCGIIIGGVLTYAYCDSNNYIAYFFTQFLGVFIGEIIILTVGIVIFELAFRNKSFKKIIGVEE